MQKKKLWIILGSGIALVLALAIALPILLLSSKNTKINWNEVLFESKTVIYDGNVHYLEVKGGDLPDSMEISYENNGHRDVGVYEVIAHFKDGDKLYPDMMATLTILKSGLEGISFEDKTVTYNGEEQFLYITGELPEGVTVHYENNGHRNAGAYEVSAVFTSTNENFEALGILKAWLRIEKAEIALDTISFEDQTFTYDGGVKSLHIDSFLPEGIQITYVNNEHRDVGVYEVTASFTDTTGNYIIEGTKRATLTILKASYDMSLVTFSSVEIPYDGLEHELLIQGQLPEGVTILRYVNNKRTELGSNTCSVEFIGDEKNYNPIPKMEATLTIVPGKMMFLTQTDFFTTYNGNLQSIEYPNLPEGIVVTYENNAYKNAGTYVVIAHFKDSLGRYIDETKMLTFHIEKATYDMSGISFEDTILVYDGLEHSLFITGKLPEGVKVSYSDNHLTEVGQIEIIATFQIPDSLNYYAIPAKKATLTIVPNELTSVFLEDETFTYDGNMHGLTLKGELPLGVTYEFINNYHKEVGIYEVIVEFNIASYAPLKATLTIVKADIDMSNVFFHGQTFVYDGKAHSIFIEGNLPDIVRVSYLNNTRTEIGIQTATAIFEVLDKIHYNDIPNLYAEITIINNQITGISFKDKTVVYNQQSHSIFIEGQLPEGVTVTYLNNGQRNVGEYEIVAQFHDATGKYEDLTDMVAKLTIVKASFATNGILFLDRSFVYDGNVHRLDMYCDDLPSDIVVVYENNDQINAGVYIVKVSFIDALGNYHPVASRTATLTIHRKKLSLDHIIFENEEYEYDGFEHTLTIHGELPEEVEVRYSPNSLTKLGRILVTASFIVDERNYEPIQASDGYEKSFNKAGSYKITVKVTSELGNLAKNDAKINKTDKSFTYTFTVVRKEGSNNNYLTNLEIYIDGLKKDYTINGVAQPFLKTNTGPYMVENVKAVSPDANIVAVKEDESATVTGDGVQTIALPDGTISQLFVIRVTAEDEVSVRDYKIQLWTTKANPSTDKALNRITATSDTDGKTNKLTPTFAQNIHQYTINLSSVEEEAILHFTKNSSDSTLYIDDGLNSVATADTSYDYSVSVSPNSSVVVTVYLTAQDGSEGDPYEITISRDAADTDATLDQFTINGKPVTGFTSGDNGGQYEVHIGDANEVYFDGVPKKSTTTISRNPAPSNDRQPLNIGSNIFTVETTAQDGKTTCRYTVNVIKDAPRILDELEALVENTNKLTPTFAPEIYRGYSVSLTFDQTSAIIKYVSQHVTAGYNTVSVFDPQGNEITSANNLITITNIAVGSTVYKVRVKTESGATADYEITFVRDAGSDDNSIIQYEYLANTGDSSYTNLTVNGVDTSYKYTVGRDITTFDPRITTSDPNAEIIMPTDLTLTPGKANIKRVIIESQTGKQKIYTFTVYPCDTDFDIDDINVLVSLGGADILDIDGTKFIDYENGNLSITVANSIAQTYLEVLGGGANSVIYVNGNKYTNQIVTLKEGTNTFVIYIKSEYGEADPAATNAQSPSVTITITRQAKSTDSTLKELTVTYVDSAGVSHTIEHLSLPGNSVLAIPNIGENVTVVNISATPTDPTSTVLGTGQRDLNDKEQAIFNFTVKCTAEDGSSTDYPIKIARGPIDVDKDNSLTYIEVSDGTGTIHLGQDSFNVNTTSYGTYHIPFEAQNYTITVVKPGYSPSIVLIDNQTVMSGTRTTTILDSDRGKTKTVKVQVQAQDGTKGQEYTIELEFDAPSQNASLSDLTADGVTVPGFTPEDQGGTYTLSPRSYDTETIEIGYKTSDSKATVVGDIGTQKLIEGVNTFVIVVTSESGTAYTYRIVVQRDYRAPYLTDLGAVGEKLLDTSYKNTTFDKEVFEYTTIVTYMTLHATINAAIDNETYTVSCSNSTAITTTGLLRSFNVDLAEGLNRFTITVTSLEGKTTEYVLTIKRRGEDSTNTDVASIEIKQIDQFKTEYTNDLREYAYQVPNGIRNLDFIVHPEKLADSNGDGATYKIINDKNLRVGHNTVVVLIIAEDMVSTRAILIDVERLPMNFTVDTEAYEKFECTATEQSTVYEIDLGDKRASAIEDYTKYIKFDQEHYDTSNQYVEEPTVTVISDIADENCREVVVSIYDGSEEQFVTFKLKSTALNTGYSIPEILQQIMPWILLAIAIIILIIILICVNRDKYGAINKKRKKDQD